MAAKTDVRKDTLYNNLLSWIADQTDDTVDYITSLKACGFTVDEIVDELRNNCSMEDDEEIEELLTEAGVIEEPKRNVITIDLDILDRELGSHKNAWAIIAISVAQLENALRKSRVDR